MVDKPTLRQSDGDLVLEFPNGEQYTITDAEWDVGGKDLIDIGAINADEVTVAGAKIGGTIDGQIPGSQIVAAGETLEIPAGYGQFVAGPMTVDGDVELDGTLTVAPGPISGEGSISGDGRIHIP